MSENPDTRARYHGRMSRLRQALLERILVLDGAMGTMLQAANLSAADFGGPQYEGCNEHLNLTRPDVVAGVHRAYRHAGADLICTNTFGCAPYVLAEYGLGERAHEIALAGARIAREAAGEGFVVGRSEERRVRKECRSRWWPWQCTKKERGERRCNLH